MRVPTSCLFELDTGIFRGPGSGLNSGWSQFKYRLMIGVRQGQTLFLIVYRIGF